MGEIDVDSTLDELDSGSLPSWITDHLNDYQQSNGEQGHFWDATEVGGTNEQPCLVLTTVGRRSGKIYDHPLLYGVDGDNYLIVGSKGGADTDPGWYFNLLASPAVELQVGKEKFVATARLAEGAEHERLWSIMTKVFPPYITYQNKTSRRIPIFVLEAE